MTSDSRATRSLSPALRGVFRTVVPALVLAVAVSTQGPNDGSNANPEGPAEAAAKKIYTNYCSTCHGATGAGDGAAAVALDPKPRTFADTKWQRSVSDDHLAKVILEGGAAVKLSPLMAPAKAMFDPEPPGTIDAMVQIVRELGKTKPPSAEAMKAAKTIYTNYCSTCHGATGAGDGAAAVALDPKPRTFADMKWQKTVSDDHMAKVILEGGAAVKLSPLMAPAKAMFDPEPPGTIDAMVQIVRELGKAGAAKAKAEQAKKAEGK